MAAPSLALPPDPAGVGPGPAPLELTAQSMVGGLLVSAVLALSYPFVVLKLGMGTGSSMTSALLGALFLRVFARRTQGANRHQNLIIQTMCSSATSTAFMCVVMAAFAYLTSNWNRDVGFNPAWWQVLLWLTCSGCIGVLFVTRFRRFFMGHPRMLFPSGVAAAVLIKTLDEVEPPADPEVAQTLTRTQSLGISSLIGFAVAVGRDLFKWLGEITINAGYRVTLGFDAVSVGTGLLLPLRVGLSFILGALVMWGAGDTVIPYAHLDASHGQFKAALLWFMWPATAFMISASLASLAVNTWVARRQPAATPTEPTPVAVAPPAADEDLPLRVTIIGTVALTALLAGIQYVNFGVSPVKTLAAISAQLVLILAAVWVAGETNVGPVSLMANGVQFIFGLIWRHDVKGNLIAAGMAGDGTAQAEQVMFTYKSGKILGSTPRAMTLAQLIGVPIGALAVAIVFPVLVQVYGIGAQGKLSAPTGLKLANMAILIDQGFDAFPKGALTWSLVALALGILLPVLSEWETHRNGIPFHPFAWLPSPSALGFGLIIPPSVTLMLGVGSIISAVWSRVSKLTFERHHQTVSAGLVVGEALISGLLLPILGALGWIKI